MAEIRCQVLICDISRKRKRCTRSGGGLKRWLRNSYFFSNQPMFVFIEEGISALKIRKSLKTGPNLVSATQIAKAGTFMYSILIYISEYQRTTSQQLWNRQTFLAAFKTTSTSAMNMFAYLFFSYATSHIESETECHCSQSYWLGHRALVFSSSFFLAPARLSCAHWPVGRPKRCRKNYRVKDFSRFARRVGRSVLQSN